MRRKSRTSAHSSPESGDLVDQLVDQLMARLELRACWFEPFPFDSLLPRIESDRIVLPPDEPGTRSYRDWQPPDGIELPIRYGALTLGRFVLVPRVLTCGVVIPPGQRTDAVAIARRAGEEIRRRWTGSTTPRASAERGSTS